MTDQENKANLRLNRYEVLACKIDDIIETDPMRAFEHSRKGLRRLRNDDAAKYYPGDHQRIESRLRDLRKKALSQEVVKYLLPHLGGSFEEEMARDPLAVMDACYHATVNINLDFCLIGSRASEKNREKRRMFILRGIDKVESTASEKLERMLHY